MLMMLRYQSTRPTPAIAAFLHAVSGSESTYLPGRFGPLSTIAQRAATTAAWWSTRWLMNISATWHHVKNIATSGKMTIANSGNAAPVLSEARSLTGAAILLK